MACSVKFRSVGYNAPEADSGKNTVNPKSDYSDFPPYAMMALTKSSP